jgi:hypothetical protein
METPWNNPAPWLIFGGIAAAIGVVMLIVALADARRRRIGPWQVVVVAVALAWLALWFLGSAADEGVLSRLLASYPAHAREVIIADIRAAARVALFAAGCLAVAIGLVGIFTSFAILGPFAKSRLLRHEMVASKSYRRLVEHRHDLGQLARAWLWAMHFLFSLMALGWGALVVSIMFGFKPDVVAVWLGQILMGLVLLVTMPQFWDDRLVRKLRQEDMTGRGDAAPA